MSETNPTPITHDGKTITAVEVLIDYIISVTPGAEFNKDVFAGYNQAAKGIIRWVNELPGPTGQTFGTAIGWENPTIQVTVRGDANQYLAPRDEAIRLRYAILALHDHTYQGVTIHACTSPRTLEALGRDMSDRDAFRITVEAMTSKSYV